MAELADWGLRTLNRLEADPLIGYAPQSDPAAEPVALAALALVHHDRTARPGLDWLVGRQQADGSVSAVTGLDGPRWPTSLAILAWQAARIRGLDRYDQPIQRAVDWTLSQQGQTIEKAPYLGHDTTLVGWPWVDGTHSWIEPTALHVLALKSIGYGEHPRTREAVRLLVDRQLPSGGCNCGNTLVLGQELRPHTQPSGMALMALADESRQEAQDAAATDRLPAPRNDKPAASRSSAVTRSLAYLAAAVDSHTTATSLAWSLLALSAHRRRPPQAGLWLERADDRVARHDRSPYKQAMLVLAATEPLPFLRSSDRSLAAGARS